VEQGQQVDPSLVGLELEVDESMREQIRKWLQMQANMKRLHNFIRR
jgi:hypothetical protein